MVDMPVTERGIYHNLSESNYTVSNGETVLFFSSKLYRNKFLDKYPENRVIFYKKFAKNVVEKGLNTNFLADLTLYMEIEIRGFYVWINGVEKSCLESHQYAFDQVTRENTRNWSKMSRVKLEELRRIMALT